MRKKHGWVYILSWQRSFKIGMTTRSVEQRVSDIARGAPTEPKILRRFWSQDPQQLERQLHQHFSRYRRRGEWFALPDDWEQQIDRVVRETLYAGFVYSPSDPEPTRCNARRLNGKRCRNGNAGSPTGRCATHRHLTDADQEFIASNLSDEITVRRTMKAEFSRRVDHILDQPHHQAESCGGSETVSRDLRAIVREFIG